MKKERQRSAMSKPGPFIPGIYNFCDRWCERCSLTARCLRFSLQSHSPDTEREGACGMEDREDFWQRLESSLKPSTAFISETARQRRLKLSAAELKALSRKQNNPTPETAAHPLAIKAQAYVQEVNRWFEYQRQLLYGKEKEIEAGAQLGVAGVYEEIASLTEIVETIRWDQYLILLMLLRGIQDRLDSRPNRSERERPDDADGAIKVALLSVDRSIAAWMRLREHFPDHTDGILSHLVELDRLRRSITAEFPRARDFVRPGFDTPPGGSKSSVAP